MKMFERKKKNKTKTVFARIDEATYNQLVKHNVHISDVIRQALERAIAKAKIG